MGLWYWSRVGQDVLRYCGLRERQTHVNGHRYTTDLRELKKPAGCLAKVCSRDAMSIWLRSGKLLTRRTFSRARPATDDWRQLLAGSVILTMVRETALLSSAVASERKSS